MAGEVARIDESDWQEGNSVANALRLLADRVEAGQAVLMEAQFELNFSGGRYSPEILKLKFGIFRR